MTEPVIAVFDSDTQAQYEIIQDQVSRTQGAEELLEEELALS